MTRSRRRTPFFALIPAVMLLVGCSGSDAAVGPTSATAASATLAPPTGGGVVVPGFDGSAGVDAPGVTVPGAPGSGDAVTTTVLTTATASSPSPSADPLGSEAAPTTAAPAQTTAPPATTAAPSTPASPATTATPAPPSTPSPTSAVPTTSAPPSTTAPAGQVLSVELSGCEGCEVIASQESVVGGRAAALISRSGRGAVVSVDPGGAVVGVANIPYGASFPAPAGGLLPCDDSGRCVITAQQADGTAVLSVFSLDGEGRWTDLSGDSGYPSSTGKAQPVDLGGELGLAVQDTSSDLTVWMVLNWSGTEFVVQGCAPDGSVPSAGDLDPDLCLS